MYSLVNPALAAKEGLGTTSYTSCVLCSPDSRANQITAFRYVGSQVMIRPGRG